MGTTEFKDKYMEGCHMRSGKSGEIMDLKLTVTTKEAPPYGVTILMDTGLHDDGGCLVIGNPIEVSYRLRWVLGSYFVINTHIWISKFGPSHCRSHFSSSPPRFISLNSLPWCIHVFNVRFNLSLLRHNYVSVYN